MSKFEALVLTAIPWILVILIVMLLALIASPPFVCEARAERMKMRFEFHYLEGCMIEPMPGTWVPLESYVVNKEEIGHGP